MKGQVEELAGQVMRLAHDELLIHLRFFDVALAELALTERAGQGSAVAGGREGAHAGSAPFLETDGAHLFYDPVGVLRAYQKEPRLVARGMLHSLLH
ncbi:MAG: hypothetical protein J6Z33_11215, partial [Lachnospiraceae bacterium]|nr:hypothetical protein [Lachnospiraceae bacterium]